MLPRTLRLKRVRNTPLRGQVTEILRDAILSGQLPPGSMLIERELAERLGVSKTPVREALSLLDHEGLIQTVPRKGYFVSPITVQDVHNYFDLRLILEAASAEMAAARATDEQIEHLASLVPDGNSAEDISQLLSRNVEFHDAIARLSGNERLAALIRKLLLEMARIIAVGYVLQAHEKVMMAFRAHDPKGAAEAMREHICAVRDKALRVADASRLGLPDEHVRP